MKDKILLGEEEFSRLDISCMFEDAANTEGDAASRINAWLTACAPDVDWRQLMEDRERCGFNNDSYPSGLEAILLIHCLHDGFLRPSRLAWRLASCLDIVESNVAPGAAMMDYLKVKAGCMISHACATALMNEGRLGHIVEDARLSVVGDWLVIFPNTRVGLNEAVRALSKDANDLWRVKLKLQEGVSLFDAAVSSAWEAARHSVQELIIDCFADRYTKQPASLMSAFPDTLGDANLLGVILSELSRRERLHDGFSRGQGSHAWLEAVALSTAWENESLHQLLELEQLLRTEGGALLAAAREALGHVWDRSRASAIYGALTMLRHARLLKEVGGHLCDVEEAERCAAFIEGLDGGEDVLWLHNHCGDLPLADRGRGQVWNFLPPGSKGWWRWKAASRAKDRPELRQGLMEFLISWTPVDIYADLERLVVDLVASADDREHLCALSKASRRVTAIRAGALSARLDGFDLMA